MTGPLAGMVGLVTGASSGVGRATAIHLASLGARVAVTARRAPELEALAAEIGRERALPLPADGRTRPDVARVVATAIAQFGQLNFLINAAGMNIPDRRVEVLRPERWSEVIDTNLTAAFHWTQAVLPQMRRQEDGLVVHVSSVSGRWGDVSGAAYQASKHGLVGLAYATMIEERQNGIRVSLILPGLIDTPLLRNRPVPPTPELRAKMMQPDDIAAAAAFLVSLPPRTYVPELVMMPSALQAVGMTNL